MPSMDEPRDKVGPSGLLARKIEELRARSEDETLDLEEREDAGHTYLQATRDEYAAVGKLLAGTQNIVEMAAVGERITRLGNAMTAAIPATQAIPAMPSISSIAPLPMPAFPSAVTYTAQEDAQSDWERSQTADQWEYCRIVLNAASEKEWNVVYASANLDKSFDLPGRAESLDSVLATLGQEGWELTGTFGDSTGGAQMVFKRRKP